MIATTMARGVKTASRGRRAGPMGSGRAWRVSALAVVVLLVALAAHSYVGAAALVGGSRRSLAGSSSSASSSAMGTSAAIISSDAADDSSSKSTKPDTSTSISNSESSELAARGRAIGFTITILVSSSGGGSIAGRRRELLDGNGDIDLVLVSIINDFIDALRSALDVPRIDITGVSFLDTNDGAINCDIVIIGPDVNIDDILSVADGTVSLDFAFPFNIPENAIIRSNSVQGAHKFSFSTLPDDLMHLTSEFIRLPSIGAIYDVFANITIGADVFDTVAPTPVGTTPVPYNATELKRVELTDDEASMPLFLDFTDLDEQAQSYLTEHFLPMEDIGR